MWLCLSAWTGRGGFVFLPSNSVWVAWGWHPGSPCQWCSFYLAVMIIRGAGRPVAIEGGVRRERVLPNSGTATNETLTMPSPPPPGPIDPDDADHLQAWLDYFGITAEQLREAVNAAGSEIRAVTAHLLNQGASAGPG